MTMEFNKEKIKTIELFSIKVRAVEIRGKRWVFLWDLRKGLGRSLNGVNPRSSFPVRKIRIGGREYSLIPIEVAVYLIQGGTGHKFPWVKERLRRLLNPSLDKGG